LTPVVEDIKLCFIIIVIRVEKAGVFVTGNHFQLSFTSLENLKAHTSQRTLTKRGRLRMFDLPVTACFVKSKKLSSILKPTY
jgi:hypothetical protein